MDQFLIEEAKRRYPIGTRYIPAHIKENRDIKIVISHDFIIVENDQVQLRQQEGDGYNWSSVLYWNGEWAEIISKMELPLYF